MRSVLAHPVLARPILANSALALLAAAFLLPSPAVALNQVAVEDLAHHPLDAEFPSGGQLQMHIRSADVRIVGSDENKVAVSVSGKEARDSDDIKARFQRNGDFGELWVTGGPSSNVTITVKVPKSSSLKVRIFAGDVEVMDIQGDKNIELGAGDLTIGVGDAANYSRVEASVATGDIEAPPFRESHGGLFRSFEKTGSGKYKLIAHVGAGDLTLK
jgi:hypothetical protein